jgi:phage terminase large subunit GpA-like protein
MDMFEARRFSLTAITRHLGKGLSAFGVPEPLRLDEWAAEHFYLSAESSYVEQKWEAWPFQPAIMACMSNDDIREVDVMKSARVGYTKMLLACMGYNAHHKRRNQAVWQPTDDDRDEFVKTDLDPMLRDIAVMRDVFPAYLARHKDNTLQQKKFLGSMCHLKGGKAAKNYRRMSIDTGYLDELDAFDNDIEKEGDPVTLAAKRIEGATFPKLICGSTPKLKGFSLIETRATLADKQFRYAIPCPGCGEYHPLTWGGKDEAHGFKWRKHEDGTQDPSTARHLCPHCAILIDQGEYLAVWKQGRWQADDGTTIDHAGNFRDAAGNAIRPPEHIAFVDLWTAYSPAATWSNIVRDFIAAFEKAQEGDASKLKTFWNTTLGRTWEGEIEKTDAEELKNRAEPFPLRVVPRGCLLLLAGVDTQDNRLEVQVWGYGRGSEMWTIDSQIFFGNPAEDQVWLDLEEFLFETEYHHLSGQKLKIHASAIDTGGHNTQAVYAFCDKHKKRKVYAVKGRSGQEKHIKDGAGQVDVDWRGRRKKRGLILWHVGTNLAKDQLHGRLEISRPGPGYIHFSHELNDEWYRQLAGEARATARTATGTISRWTPLRKRVEVLDCTVYVIWLEYHLDLNRKPARFWDDLEEKIQPAHGDLFIEPPSASVNIDAPVRATKPPTAQKPPEPDHFAPIAIVNDSWMD